MVVIPVGIAFFNEAMTTVAGWMFFNLRKVTTKCSLFIRRTTVQTLLIANFFQFEPDDPGFEADQNRFLRTNADF